MQANLDRCKDALLSDVCISTSATPTYLPPFFFNTKDLEGNTRDFHLVDGGVAANNPVRNLQTLSRPNLLFSLT